MDAASLANAEPRTEDLIREVGDNHKKIVSEIGKVITGQEEVIDLLLIALFARGHCLFEGVPGLAKTLLVNTLADVLDLKFNRIQCTSDLMPSDVTGTDVLEEDRTAGGKRFFKFIKGPIFTNILLSDEINRTSPKTQAALLQAMQEYRVSALGNLFKIDEPFLVFATQNPIEQEGTYKLPEAQLDRFMFKVNMDYPTLEEEVAIVKSNINEARANLTKVMSQQKIVELQELTPRVPASDHVIRYAVELVRKSRPQAPDAPDFIRKWVVWGAGPRASQYLILGGKARALLNGRFAVACEDVRALAKPTLQHRILLNFHAEAERVSSLDVIDSLLKEVREIGE